MGHTLTGKLVASFGGIIAIWRLDALNMAKMGQAPIYSRWRLDGTLPLRGQLVSSVSVWKGNLAIGSNKCVSIWKRGAYASAPWRNIWSARTPRPLLRVQWSADGQFLAAVPLCDTRVLVWRVHDKQVHLISKLRHTRHVHSLHWRRAREDLENVPVLVVITSNSVVHVYTRMPEESPAFYLWASIDAASSLEGVAPASDTSAMRHVVSLMYCDAYYISVALHHDIQLLEQQEQLHITGIGNTSSAESQRRSARIKQLKQYMEQGPDVFFALLADGSLALFVLLNIEKNKPSLSQTLFTLKVPPCISAELSHAPLMLEFMPLAPSTSRVSDIYPTALIHGHTASGLRGTMAVSLLLLLDGDVHGLFVQNTTTDASMPAHSPSHAHAFLRAEHRSDILSLQTTNDHHSLLSFSRDGVMIWWNLCEHGEAVSMNSEYQVRLRNAYAVCAMGQGPNLIALDESHLVLALFDKSSFASSSSHVTTVNNISMMFSKLQGVTPDTLVALYSFEAQDAHNVVLVRQDGSLLTWTCASTSSGWVLHPMQTHRLNTDDVVCAELVSDWHPIECKPVLITLSSSGTLHVWEALTWTCLHTIETQRNAVRLCADILGHIAVLSRTNRTWKVSIYDVRLLPFASTLVHEHNMSNVAHTPSLAWTTTSDSGAMLAVSGDQRVTLFVETQFVWAPIARVDLHGMGSANISHVGWVAPHRLLVASTCQLFLFESEVKADGCNVTTQDLWTHRSHMRPYHDALFLLRCMQFGLTKDACASIQLIDAASRNGRWNHLSWSFEREPLTALRISHPIPAMLERIQANGLVDIDSHSVPALLAVLQAAHQIVRTDVDVHAKQYLLSWYASQHTSAPIIWAYLSETQEALLSKVTSEWADRISWPIVRDSGVFGWMRSREALLPIMEQVARAAFTAGDDIDPIRCSLFYLALKKPQMLKSVWRRAVGHPDQSKMIAFLGHDFSEERWRVAAQKNAYALMSQRRFEFAVAFFLLGNALSDAVHVCVRQLNDVALAIALARVFENEDQGPVFKRVLRQYAVPHAHETGDRWFGMWAHLVLGEYAEAVHMITKPLSSSVSGPLFDLPDPSLLMVLEYFKRHYWCYAALSPQDETRCVAFYAQLLSRTGCDLVGLAMLRSWSFARPAKPPSHVEARNSDPESTDSDRPEVSKKIGSLMGERRPPPAQSMAEFDMSAFGF